MRIQLGKKHAVVAVLIGACVAPGGDVAQARSCAVAESIGMEFKHSAAVFVGRVKSTDVAHGPHGTFDVQTVATFDVERWWKGPQTKTVKVRSCGTQDVVCITGIDFKPGDRYVVFATGRPLETTVCQRTELVNDAAATLKWLETIQPRKAG
jgi:hypothetical protein